MKKVATLLLLAITSYVYAQDLSYRLEELTAPDFVKAVEKSSKTCIIPIGVMEKHGPQLPLGTDLYMSREYSFRAENRNIPWCFRGIILAR